MHSQDTHLLLLHKNTKNEVIKKWSNPPETADFVTFNEEIPNGKLHFLCSVLNDRTHPTKRYMIPGIFIDFENFSLAILC